MIATYFSLTKPRMVFGNTLVGAAAFIFGSGAAIDWPSFFYTISGLWLIISSACALNNYYDRGIDARMARTKSRALAAQLIAPEPTLAIGAATFIVGTALLGLVNPLALWCGVAGWAAYALFYTPLKHVSGLALYVGAVAGAMPPVIGYVAAAGRFDLWAAGLFVVLYLWQLPHFIAIALYRFDEYAAAGVPLLVSRPNGAVRAHARKAFYASLVVLLLFCAALILQRWIR